MRRTELSISTAGGTLLSTLPLISASDILRTALLAALGATISFVVSLLLQKIRKKK